MPDVRVIGLYGVPGLIGLIALARPVPLARPGGLIRLLGLVGLLGWAGFWNPWLGACGGFGAFGLWNHPTPRLRRLAWFGFAGPVGLLLGVAILAGLVPTPTGGAADVQVIGLFGLFGLAGMIAIGDPVPVMRPGGLVRLLGLLGLLGWAGLWNPWLGACGAFGALGLWNHPRPLYARLAWLGFAAPTGLALGLALRHL